MSDMSSLQAFQRGFGEYLRNTRQPRVPVGVPAGRAKVYRELVFNNLSTFIEACFPISRKLLGERRWQRLMRGFFDNWRSQTPLFCEISREFVRWMNEASEQGTLPVAAPEYLLALAHYEWVELAVDIMQTETPADIQTGDLMTGRPVVAPAHMLLAYQWPVHRIGNSYRPRKPEPTSLVVFRDQGDEVRFAVINPVTARLLVLLADGKQTGHAACLQVAQELQHPNPEVVIAGGTDMLNDLFNWGVIYGVHR
ncbi:MAG TPA: putative DNA-binding domain-containing protein [Rhodocyclaceae bacterium]|jgi:hypothetical protein|nr:putative DNA-binding domain-containing protein [Rhodocyclaceae bacterium]